MFIHYCTIKDGCTYNCISEVDLSSAESLQDMAYTRIRSRGEHPPSRQVAGKLLYPNRQIVLPVGRT
jgi:hypothetical protein